LNKRAREEAKLALGAVFTGQLSEEDNARIVRDVFRLRSCEKVDTMRLSGTGRALLELVEVRGREYIDAALTAEKGAILCSAHFGRPENCLALLGAMGFPVTLIARWSFESKRRNPGRWQLLPGGANVRRLRHHVRGPNIEDRSGNLDAAFRAAAILRRNELVFINLDALVRAGDRERAVPVHFLNGQVLLMPGAITIAQLTGAPILMTLLYRRADWRHQVLEVSPPVSVEGDRVTVLERCLAFVESAIRRNPAHWRGWELNKVIGLGLFSEDTFSSEES
jgi:lauroyl/myristoyl acyltransferase